MAVLELARPVSMKSHIQPLCLGEEELRPGLEARVAGWGATHPTLLTRPKVLQTTEVITVDNKLCEQWHWYETKMMIEIDILLTHDILLGMPGSMSASTGIRCVLVTRPGAGTRVWGTPGGR